MRVRDSHRIGLLAVLSVFATAPTTAETIDGTLIGRMVDEGFNHSQIPQTVSYLTDRIGGRLTNSPQMREAERWTQERFRAWGLSEVRAEGFPFGRGWSIQNASVRLVAPRVRMLRAIPSPGHQRLPVRYRPGSSSRRSTRSGISRHGVGNCRARSC